MQKCRIQADCVTPFHTLQRTQSLMIESVDQQYTASDAWGDLKGARFDACTFQGVNWADKDLRGARFENCTWVDCDLSNVRTLGWGLQIVRFEGCKLVGVNFSICNELGLNVHFDGCILDAANFEGMDLRQVSWSGGRAREVDFTGANCEKVVFEGLDLAGASFERTRLERADFRTATGWRIQPDQNRIRHAKFRRDQLEGLLMGWELDLDE